MVGRFHKSREQLITKYPPPRYRIIIGELRTVAGFEFEPCENDIDSILKIKNRSDLPDDISRLISTMRDEALDLVKVRSVYGIFQPTPELKRYFPKAQYIALGLVTIGSDLEKRAESLEKAGETSRSLIIDAWGSAIVEGAVSSVDRTISLEAELIACSRKRRRSPGYHPWPLEAQRDIFQMLSGDDIRVFLTENLMMNPRKSVTFGVELTLK